MWEQIAANRRKSFVLVAGAALLLAALGWALGEYFGGQGAGPGGVAVALAVWFVMTMVAWRQGDQVFLTMSGAKKVKDGDLPQLRNVVEEMTLAAGLPRVPDIYVIDDEAPNAFATGRRPETAAVAVTSGLLKTLNRDELQGVIAHEIAHVRNRDILLMLFAGVLAGAIVILAEVGLRGMWFGGGRSRSRRDGDGGGQGIIALIAVVLMIVAPIIAQLIYFAVSRKREYLADASAASFTRYPEGLAAALEKIAASPRKLASANSATAPMYIINPLKRAGKAAANATSTHPPIDERVRILRAMGRSSFAAYDEAFRQVKGGRRGVVPGSALAEEKEAAVRGASGDGPVLRDDPLRRERARQVDDFIYRADGWQRIECPCGTVLKLPADFAAPRARCPRCGRVHNLQGD
ncbi:MAG: M48 family metalloprotease [Krumholzibacteria bacterium]|nr:M48 family metalloprotease [Candidatus Krumholzibacteria bacterium]